LNYHSHHHQGVGSRHTPAAVNVTNTQRALGRSNRNLQYHQRIGNRNRIDITIYWIAAEANAATPIATLTEGITSWNVYALASHTNGVEATYPISGLAAGRPLIERLELTVPQFLITQS